jgi:hypothetical protein
MPKKTGSNAKQLWANQLVLLAGLTILGSLIAYYVPQLSNPSTSFFARHPNINFHQVAALVLLLALSVIYLAYFRVKMYFSTRWFIAAVTYNFLLLFIKFTLSINEFAGHSTASFGSVISTALLISLLYIFAFLLLYLVFDGRILNRSLHKALIVSSEGKILLAMGLFVCATVVRIVAFHLPILSNTAASAYLGDIFKGNAALLNGVLFIMSIAAVEAYAQVRRRADLKYFFVSGTALILAFHLWWAIFIYRIY